MYYFPCSLSNTWALQKRMSIITGSTFPVFLHVPFYEKTFTFYWILNCSQPCCSQSEKKNCDCCHSSRKYTALPKVTLGQRLPPMLVIRTSVNFSNIHMNIVVTNTYLDHHNNCVPWCKIIFCASSTLSAHWRVIHSSNTLHSKHPLWKSRTCHCNSPRALTTVKNVIYNSDCSLLCWFHLAVFPPEWIKRHNFI